MRIGALPQASGRSYVAPLARTWAQRRRTEHPEISAMRRPRVLVITPWHPEPVDNGSKIRARALVEGLSSRYDVVLVSMVGRQDGDPDSLPAIPGVWRQFGLVQKEYQPRSLRSLAAGFSRLPRSMVVTWDEEAARTIQAIAVSLAVDVVVGADLRVVRYLYASAPDLPIVLDEANVSPFVPEDHRKLAVRSRIRARKYRAVLADMSARNGVVIVPSGEEARAYERITGNTNVLVIDNAALRMPDVPWTVPDGRRLLYTGSIAYGPNREAIDFFAREVMPLLEASDADVHLFVTGTAPADDKQVERHPRIRLTGMLPDLDPAYRNSRIFVAPLLSGTGTRTKILEAMSYGMPVVSTSKGVEGLAVSDNEHLLVADSPADMAAAIVRLLDDPALSIRLGLAARQRVVDRYCWQTRAFMFCDVVDAVLARQCED